MLVILRENVDHLGQIGDVVKVSDGYARNFLIPRRLVEQASDKNIKHLDHQKKLLEKKRVANEAQAREIAAKLAEHSCTITKKVGVNDKLFGSVTNAEIADALNSAGFKVERRNITVAEPIKTIGVHTVKVKLLPTVETDLKVWIAKEEE